MSSEACPCLGCAPACTPLPHVGAGPRWPLGQRAGKWPRTLGRDGPLGAALLFTCYQGVAPWGPSEGPCDPRSLEMSRLFPGHEEGKAGRLGERQARDLAEPPPGKVGPSPVSFGEVGLAAAASHCSPRRMGPLGLLLTPFLPTVLEASWVGGLQPDPQRRRASQRTVPLPAS